MSSYLFKKNDLFKIIKICQGEVESKELTVAKYKELISDYSKLYSRMSLNTWKKLMNYEATLFDRLEYIDKSFEHNVTEIVNVFTQTTQNKFTDIRAIEQIYHDAISAIANRYVTIASMTPGFEVAKGLRSVSF